CVCVCEQVSENMCKEGPGCYLCESMYVHDVFLWVFSACIWLCFTSMCVCVCVSDALSQNVYDGWQALRCKDRPWFVCVCVCVCVLVHVVYVCNPVSQHVSSGWH